MKCTLSNTIMFTVGAAVGSAVTWYFAKGYFAKIAQEEIDSVKEVFSKFAEEEENNDIPVHPAEEGDCQAPDPEYIAAVKPAYSALAKQYETPAFKTEEKEVSDVDRSEDRPYVIRPDEYGQFYDYKTFELTYYADGVLADDTDEIVEDIDDIIGYESLKHFGEYDEEDPDILHVRNDRLKSDYEIAMVNTKFSDVAGVYTHLADN